MASRRNARSPSIKVRKKSGKHYRWISLIALTALVGWYAFQPSARREEVNRLLRNSIERDKNIDPLDIAWDIYQLYYSPDFVKVPPPPGDNTNTYGGLPATIGANGQSSGLRLLANRGYLIGYDDRLPGPLWAAYRCADITPLPSTGERPESFEIDRRTVSRVSSNAYTGTGYDRGHLAPNYAIASRYGQPAQLETFLLSNIIPQKHSLNAGLWKQLEMRIATSYPARFGEIWVVAGPVFNQQPPVTLGRGGPAVPDACYMILLDESDGRLRSMAFIFPQDASGELAHYLTTIDTIEIRTGLDFFSAIEDKAEALLESQRAGRVW